MPTTATSPRRHPLTSTLCRETRYDGSGREWFMDLFTRASGTILVSAPVAGLFVGLQRMHVAKWREASLPSPVRISCLCSQAGCICVGRFSWERTGIQRGDSCLCPKMCEMVRTGGIRRDWVKLKSPRAPDTTQWANRVSKTQKPAPYSARLPGLGTWEVSVLITWPLLAHFPRWLTTAFVAWTLCPVEYSALNEGHWMRGTNSSPSFCRPPNLINSLD
jgi:hypothetical protein